MDVDVSEWLGRHIYVTGEYEPATTKVVRDRLKRGGVFVDVGANAGYFSLLAARLVGSEGHVFSYEPVPTTARQLRANIDRNLFRHCDVTEAAISNATGTCQIHVGPRDHTGVSSLREVADSTGTVTVPLTTLDVSLADVPQVDLVKIDVEGAECHVLEGMHDVLHRCRPDIILEVTQEFLATLGRPMQAIEDVLAPFGYRAHVIDDNGPRPLTSLAEHGSSQFNAYFTARAL
jgi:FkbM family methyltransferase